MTNVSQGSGSPGEAPPSPGLNKERKQSQGHGSQQNSGGGGFLAMTVEKPDCKCRKPHAEDRQAAQDKEPAQVGVKAGIGGDAGVCPDDLETLLQVFAIWWNVCQDHDQAENEDDQDKDSEKAETPGTHTALQNYLIGSDRLDHGNNIFIGGFASDLVAGADDEALGTGEGLEDFEYLASNVIGSALDQGLDGGDVAVEGSAVCEKAADLGQVGDVAAGRAFKGADAVEAKLSQLGEDFPATTVEVVVDETATLVGGLDYGLEDGLIPGAPDGRAEQREGRPDRGDEDAAGAGIPEGEAGFFGDVSDVAFLESVHLEGKIVNILDDLLEAALALAAGEVDEGRGDVDLQEVVVADRIQSMLDGLPI